VGLGGAAVIGDLGYPDGPAAVRAPVEALGWSPQRGWLTSADELDEAMLEGELVLSADDDGWVRDVEGDCSLALAMRIDREVTQLSIAFTDLYERLLNAAEEYTQALSRASRNTDHG
jgi:hypothetical protein